ncbi:hypothetical protein SARC_01031 [Sphaeroforma arctica JP610]|uniref:Kinesin-like protein n=1 Tax=Sphaeroforma arctica JP610 TaxID=667725 RepID=A0A0L0GEW7_9EUKA|nr:hypothetical protein SARC_01031 [Sphaeroforma arctica JP610]KNC86838.1 hypothetical protein SARC_01031 [Sphaeroforma arctica JP610]|eukprot:XP_014160740.1 hypothetical protein SARC_01031 [Sphaeroforma arctica JP610]
MSFRKSREPSGSDGARPVPTKSKSTAGDNIKVVVRVRPLLKDEIVQKQETAWRTTHNSIVRRPYTDPSNKNKPLPSFVFDKVYNGHKTQEIYDEIGESMVTAAMEGYNSTIFAYGETNSGKTHTMKGIKQEPGFIPQALKDVFSYIEEYPGREYVLRVSYIEIYNEAIHDLLDPAAPELKLVAHKTRGIIVAGIKEQIVTSYEHVMPLVASGEAHRHVGRTNYNSFSSRSHTILQLIIESRPAGVTPCATPSPERNKIDPAARPVRAKGQSSGYGQQAKKEEPSNVRVSVLNLIDLAGSEKAADDAARFREGQFINKSLLTLGTVIMKLSSGTSTHIPYRDSKLTRLLQNSLTGNARIAMITTINPTVRCFDESKKSLLFAQGAKKIKTAAKINQLDDSILQRYKDEIKALQMRVDELESNHPRVNELQAQIEALRLKGDMTEQEMAGQEREMRIRIEMQDAIIADYREQKQRLTRQIIQSHRTIQPTNERRATVDESEENGALDHMRTNRHGLAQTATLADDFLNLEDHTLPLDDTSLSLIRLQSVDSLKDEEVKASIKNDLKQKEMTINTLKLELQHARQDNSLLDERIADQQAELDRLTNHLQAIHEALNARGIILPEMEGWAPDVPVTLTRSNSTTSCDSATSY